MDNYKYYSGSMTHDFDMFMPRATTQSTAAAPKPRKKGTVIKYPVVAKKAKAQARTVSKPISAIIISAVVLVMLCANIYTRAEVTSIRSEINNVKTEINTLESVQARLQCELEQKVSFKNLEKEAKKIGMKKMDKSQIIYIRTNKENKAVDKNGNVIVD